MSTSTTTTSAKNLITEDNIRKVLLIDKGSDARLESWKIVDFTKPGDNFMSFVTSVEVEYNTCDRENCAVTYVVKLNPQTHFGDFQELEPVVFAKEGEFYEKLVPVLNKILTSAGQEPLHLPKCFIVSLEDGREQIYFEDLRPRNFKMVDKNKGLDKEHVILIMSELARLNSASYILRKNILEGVAIASKYEFLSKDFLTFTPNSKDLFVTWFQKCIDTGIMMLEKVGGYETVIDWLKNTKEEVAYHLSTGLQSERFNSICHGDCWNNNILFRYNNEGYPVEVMFVDLQCCREASIACDLNSLLYTSVTGDVRKPNLDHFLHTYYSTYKEVLDGGNMPMFFTKEEFTEEFRSKNIIGLLFAIDIVPSILMDPEEVPDFSNTDLETVMEGFRNVSLEKLKTNPLCKPRFLAVFDDLIETGLIS